MYGISTSTSKHKVDDSNLSTLQVCPPYICDLFNRIEQTSLVLLSLQMVADGIPIDLFSLLKVKFNLVNLLGFVDAALLPSPTGHSFYVRYGRLLKFSEHAFPCIDGVIQLLDAFQYMELPTSAMSAVDDHTTTNMLVGAVIVDTILHLFSQLDHASLTKLPAVVIKNLLKALTVITYKHKFEDPPLRHLREALHRAIKRATDMLVMDISYEIRQVALSACYSYLKRWPHYAVNVLMCVIFPPTSCIVLIRVGSYQCHTCADLIANLGMNSDDILVAQCAHFMQTSISQYVFHIKNKSFSQIRLGILQMDCSSNCARYN